MLTRQHIASLSQMAEAKDAKGMHKLLSNLSAADRKKGKTALGERLGIIAENDVLSFLDIYAELLAFDLNLYFSAFLRTLEKISTSSKLWDNISYLDRIGVLLSRSRIYYRQRILKSLLPKLAEPYEATSLLDVLHISGTEERLKFLLDADTLYAHYEAFRIMALEDVQASSISRYVRQLLSQQESGLPYDRRESVANFLTHYFNGVDAGFRFTVTLDATSFSYAEKSFSAFLNVIMPSSRIGSYLDHM